MIETLFKQVSFMVGSLIKFIEIGHIGVPDIQQEISLSPDLGYVAVGIESGDTR